MTAQQTASAQIIQFPARGRFAPDYQESKPAASARAVLTACGAAWYHDEAIRDAADEKKN
jgi:hypothetical protein